MHMNRWDNDNEFKRQKIVKVEGGPGAYAIHFDGGTAIGCASDFEPRPGDEAILFGRGIGYPVRGLIVGGREVWYMQMEGSEFGPLTTTEMQVILDKGTLNGKLYAWQPGMPKWLPIEEVGDLAKIAAQAARIASGQESDKDKRGAKRMPLLATVEYEVDGGPVLRGICRDISLTGMQVHASCRELTLGSGVRLVVFPVNENLMARFEVQARIARLHPSGTSFGVKFHNVSHSLSARIEAFARKASSREY
jgi:hypothetical protein